MSDSETAPLLSGSAKGKSPASHPGASGETTPLLSSSAETPRYDGEQDEPDRDARSADPARRTNPRRWPSIIAMVLLALAIVAIIVLAFVIPDAVQEYAKQAAVIEPTNLSLESITPDGVQARVQANFRLDASRVANADVRRIGKATTWFARQLGTDETRVAVYLPDYDNTLLGTAVIPPLVINLLDGYTTSFDFVTDITTGDLEGIRSIANEWLEGRLDMIRLKGATDLSLKSGIIPLGTHSVAETLVFEANKIPAMPQYNITRFVVHDVPSPGDKFSMVADVSISAFNEYPVQLDIPELAFEILVPGCTVLDPLIPVADAVTNEVNVKPRSEVSVDVHGLIRELPDALTQSCPNSNSSPLDALLGHYMHGRPASFFVKGSSQPDGSTPRWIADVLASIVLPVALPGRTLGGLIRAFALTDVNFKMPDEDAHEGEPGANPKVSGTIHVTAGMPSDINFDINVTNIKASANVFYKHQKLGELNVEKWQHANSTRHPATKDEEATLEIEARVIDAPLNITDPDVFTDVIQTLIFGHKNVTLEIEAGVDVMVETALGNLTLRDVPASGRVPVKRPY